MRRRLALASTEDLLNASTRFQAAPEYRRAASSSSTGSGSESWAKNPDRGELACIIHKGGQQSRRKSRESRLTSRARLWAEGYLK